ncbi:MAG: methyl-accepting chemotaxis protein [Phycisphaeraceae bacterium]|nr:methyl-accepting chemotaxis protein [Phycisphaeraceae bacterium]QYK49044.1 MAG: methyl-accepting chemotaxis protein [Phycisphaeraceae bacterium]
MKLLNSLRVRTKLAIGFGAALAFMATLSGVALYQASNAKETAQALSELAVEVNESGELGIAVNRLRANAIAYLLDSSQRRKDLYMEREREAFAALDHSAETFEHPAALEKVRDVKDGVSEYAKTFARITALRERMLSLYSQTMDPIGLRAAAEFYEPAVAASKAGHGDVAVGGFEGVLEMNRTRVRVQRYLISKNPEDFTGAINAAEKCIALLKETAAKSPAEYGSRFKVGAEQFEQYWAAAQEVYSLSEQIETIRRETLDPLASRMSDTCNALATMVTKQAEEVSAASIGSLTRSSLKTMIIAFVAIGFGIASAIVITRSITVPVRTVIDRLKDIAQGEGDLTRRIDLARSDEFGELSNWFNQFVERIHNVMKRVAETTNIVNSASAEIAAAAEETATGLQLQSKQAHQVSAAVEELSATVADVAKKSEGAASAASDAKRDAREGGTVVSDTVTEMKRIAEEVGTSASAVNTLGQKSEEIGRIIDVINDIADQTNLLALNAAIEAARAGEHGRGFAVVADEVRKLSERTTRATEEVASSIRDIQENTSSAVQLIESGSSRVTKGVELANAAGSALGRIVDGSGTVGTMVTSIAAAATEQAAAAEQIARSVEQINAVTNEAAQGAQQSAQAASQLRQQAEHLTSLIGSFKL